MNRSQALIAKIKALLDDYDGDDGDDLGATLRRAMDGHEELHTSPEVARIAGIGDAHPERVSDPEVQTLCGAVLRHIERQKDGR